MKASDNPFPKVILNEALSDGSDFANPAADYRVLFLGEDGGLHLKDSAGTVTDIGGGGGDVATDAIWDAKGDLAVGTGANTAQKLTVGTNNYLLVAASGETTGLKWQRFPTFSGARAYNSTTQAINGGPTAVTLNSEDFDTDNYHDTGSNTSRMTAPADGYYFVTASTTCAANNVYIYIYLNGSAVRGSQFGAATVVLMLRTTALVYMTAGQYVEMYVFTGSNQNVGSATAEQSSTLSIFRLG